MLDSVKLFVKQFGHALPSNAVELGEVFHLTAELDKHFFQLGRPVRRYLLLQQVVCFIVIFHAATLQIIFFRVNSFE